MGGYGEGQQLGVTDGSACILGGLSAPCGGGPATLGWVVPEHSYAADVSLPAMRCIASACRARAVCRRGQAGDASMSHLTARVGAPLLS